VHDLQQRELLGSCNDASVATSLESVNQWGQSEDCLGDASGILRT
jgi:hypothetical protein